MSIILYEHRSGCYRGTNKSDYDKLNKSINKYYEIRNGCVMHS